MKTAACLATALVAGAVVTATQSPSLRKLGGEAAAPASPLSLWHRAPPSDHPLLPTDAPRESRQAGTAEWVRALPVGNGRHGVAVFGYDKRDVDGSTGDWNTASFEDVAGDVVAASHT
jgi:hypothetical protein